MWHPFEDSAYFKIPHLLSLFRFLAWHFNVCNLFFVWFLSPYRREQGPLPMATCNWMLKGQPCQTTKAEMIPSFSFSAILLSTESGRYSFREVWHVLPVVSLKLPTWITMGLWGQWNCQLVTKSVIDQPSDAFWDQCRGVKVSDYPNRFCQFVWTHFLEGEITQHIGNYSSFENLC